MTMAITQHISLLILSALILPALSESPAKPNESYMSNFQSVTVLRSHDQFQELIASSSVTIVYFHVKESKQAKSFFEEYERSAKLLEAYGAAVTLTVFDCLSDTSKEIMCERENVQMYIYSYQNGNDLLTLEADTMFDVNSIMSCALQLVMLQEVSIVQSHLERQSLEKSAVGKQTLLLAYIQAFGTAEHRIFMEIAYTFHDQFEFSLTTEPKASSGLQGSEDLKSDMPFSMWVLFCAESNLEDVLKSGDCDSILYRGEVSLSALAGFVKRLSEPMVYHLPEDGLQDVFDMSPQCPVIFLYTNKRLSEQVQPAIDELSFEMRGNAKLVIMDMDDSECKEKALEQGFHGKLPTLSVMFENGTVSFMDPAVPWENVDAIQNFVLSIFDQMSHEKDDEAEVVHSTDLEKLDDISELIAEVENQDDQVATAVAKILGEKKKVDIPALYKSSFYPRVKAADLLIVLFYLPFDDVGVAFLQDYEKASQILATNFSETDALVQVNCFDASDLCSAENITVSPVVRIYQKNRDTQDYMGSLDSASVVRAFMLLQLETTTLLTTTEEAEKFLEGNYPKDFKRFTHSSVIFMSSKADSDEEMLFRDVAKSLSTITAFAVAHGDVAKSIADKYGLSLPVVMSHHRDDVNKPIRTLSLPFSASALTNFIKLSNIQSVPELTVSNFPSLYAQKKPFVILFIDSPSPESDAAKDMLNQLAMASQTEELLFCWMSAPTGSLGLHILSEYTYTAILPMMSVVDHRKGEVYNFQADTLKLEEVQEWLTKVVDGKEQPSKILQKGKWAAPGKHYDFLSFIDKAEKNKKELDSSDGHSDSFEDDISEDDNNSKVLSEAPTNEELEKVEREDSETREELLERTRNRLYHQKHGRQGATQKQPSGKQEASNGHTHSHTEL